MRTKALLCAAAVAAGALSSWAQSNVYSLNIVGYANVAVGGANQIWANPVNTGVSNGANEIFSYGAQTLPDNTIISTFNHNNSTFAIALYDTSIGLCANNWYKGDGSTCNNPPSLPPGVGFFINPGNTFTNTFVGQVGYPDTTTGHTNTVAYQAGTYLIGSILPVGGYVTNTIWQLGPPNQLPDNTIFNKFNPANSTFTTALFDSSIGLSPDGWYLKDGSTPGPPANIAIGEGFYVNWGGPYNWAQTLGN